MSSRRTVSSGPGSVAASRSLAVAALVVLALMALAAPVPAEDVFTVSLWADPSALIPLGPVDAEGDLYYTPGGGSSLGLCLSPVRAPVLLMDAQAGEDVLVVNFLNRPMSLTRIGVGFGISLGRRTLEARLQAHGGYYYGVYGPSQGGNAYYDASLSFLIKLSTAFGLGLTGGWREYLNLGGSSGPTLARGVFGGLGLSLYPSELRARTRIEFREILIHPLYPILMKYYDTHPVGRIVFVNRESQDISDVKVSFYLPGYMDGPTLCAEIPLVRKGQEATADLRALLNANVLKITESVVNRAEIRLDYKVLDKVVQAAKDDSARLLDRNAMSWDDDRKAAAFVTAKDPDVLAFAKTIGSAAQASPSLYGDKALRAALGLFEALDAAGIRYVQDPKSPYAAIDKGKDAIDYLQFPAQTLSYRSGDCDDLSALYVSLLEAIGIETAMVTTPGHIFAAFALDMGETEARSFFSSPELLLFRDGKSWMPVETTMIGKGFAQAWRQGAREYGEARGQASEGFLPVHDSWSEYEPVGLIEGIGAPAPPDPAAQEARWAKEWLRLSEMELSAREADILGKTAQAKSLEKAKLQNKLGILYARFGLFSKAAAQFVAAAAAGLQAAAVNQASVDLIQGRNQEAFETLARVLLAEPDSQGALSGYVQAARRLGRDADADAVLERLKARNPALAARLSASADGATGRAAEGPTDPVSLWVED